MFTFVVDLWFKQTFGVDVLFVAGVVVSGLLIIFNFFMIVVILKIVISFLEH